MISFQHDTTTYSSENEIMQYHIGDTRPPRNNMWLSFFVFLYISFERQVFKMRVSSFTHSFALLALSLITFQLPFVPSLDSNDMCAAQIKAS